jgi:hypothetical protein
MTKLTIYITSLLISYCSFAQSDLDKILKGGELLLGGLSIVKMANSNGKSDSKTIASLCVKNKLADKITFTMIGKDENDNEIKKELIIPKDGKECLYNVPKGVWSYQIDLANKETYKKGEYKLEDEITIMVKTD